MIQFRRLSAVADADGRIFITITKFYSRRVVLEFLCSGAYRHGTRLVAQLPAFFAIFADLRRERCLIVEARAHLGRFVDVDHGDRFTFRGVAVEQFRSAPSVKHGGEFPADINGIANSRIHAETSRGPAQVRGIAGEKHAAFLIAFGDYTVAGPRTNSE